ncbi:hypothetical protein [Lacinutrix himadriensis]|uniref:hypothetical protein n=1 Tax=Lacinutrix himadriensis TaxID=641549 RepID=UPI00128ED832|nr:hypothetical protein [Lacinutrix himadriensis]
MIYNKKGLVEQEFWYDFSNELESRLYYSYDKNENLIEEKEVFFDDEFLLIKNHYNTSNKAIASSSYFSEEPNEFSHRYYIRDLNNNIIETKIIDEDGEDYSIVNDLNEQQKIIKTYRRFLVNWRRSKGVQLKFKEKERNMYEYDYDKNGNKILQLNYNESRNKIYSKHVWRFNNRNKLVELKLYYNMIDTTNYKMLRYNYNEKDLRIYEEETSSKDSTFKSIKTFYNQEDYIIKTIVFENGKTEVLNYKYKFDKKGNWTKIIKTVNSEPLYVWTRKIKYY